MATAEVAEKMAAPEVAEETTAAAVMEGIQGREREESTNVYQPIYPARCEIVG
jgi:hypothetical protein